MTLLDIYEDLFQYVCVVNRTGRLLVSADHGLVCTQIEQLLNEISRESESDAVLREQVKQLELPVLFFIDEMIRKSKLSFAAQWKQLAWDRNQRAGAQKFFELLEQTLADQSEPASERLAIFYICLGLGFTGIHDRQPERLRAFMDRIAPRIERWIDEDVRARVFDGAYAGVNRTDLGKGTDTTLLVIALVFLCGAVAVGVTYYWLFVQASHDFNAAVQKIHTVR